RETSEQRWTQYAASLIAFSAMSFLFAYVVQRFQGFLPFNLGHLEGKGNPPNPHGCRTAYLWERVLEREEWLHILGSFVHLERKLKDLPDGRKYTEESLIFPRFHQWDAVLKLLEAAKAEKAGHTYLIEHSGVNKYMIYANTFAIFIPPYITACCPYGNPYRIISK
ncbi:MAG: potassium-transporting ATPase subunit KdpA, partial [Desulfomonilia bacterium]